MIYFAQTSIFFTTMMKGFLISSNIYFSRITLFEGQVKKATWLKYILLGFICQIYVSNYYDILSYPEICIIRYVIFFSKTSRAIEPLHH
ncbi:hypothetical protein C2G38_2097736 [Gigaspora rosea]|uniref:Uncharacterized protein n=1 Tax=Gigaspora rosea TaxID=44941 RepID=A0A397UUA6_9GLOM|nr:hypothetical protein C2G38_2097736 [Gigaspora rosea]